MRLADLARLNAARAARRPIALVTDVAGGGQRIVEADALHADALADAIAERFRLGKSGMVTDAAGDHFVTVQVPPTRLVAIGAVHISQALATMARLAELDVTIVDPREAFATQERFPEVELIAEWPDAALPRIGLDRYTAVCLLTHDPKIDDPALIAALKAECFYIGALGSRKTHARRLERMREAGFDDGELARIHAPIGLDIGAVSPAEIAVAILGEIVAALRRKPKRQEARDETARAPLPEGRAA